MEIELTGKRALVTGGSSGIGKAIVRALAVAGAGVAVNYIGDPSDAEALAGEIRDEGGRAVTAEADVSDPDAVDAMFGRVESELGPVDLLVNNAGIDGKRAPTHEIAPDDWHRVIEVNLYGPFHCARRALPGMIDRGTGVILNISSVHEVIPWSGYGAYAAAKAGVSMLTKTIAQEAAPHGVRVLALAPGAVRTPINRDVWDDEKGMADLKRKIPLDRIGETDEIARVAVVLCSEAASYVLGTTVFVDGGMTLYPSFTHGG